MERSPLRVLWEPRLKDVVKGLDRVRGLLRAEREGQVFTTRARPAARGLAVSKAGVPGGHTLRRPHGSSGRWPFASPRAAEPLSLLPGPDPTGLAMWGPGSPPVPPGGPEGRTSCSPW